MELEALKNKYETTKKDYLGFLRLKPEECMEFLSKEDEAVILGKMKEKDSSLPVFKESATEEEKEKVKEVIITYRLDQLRKKKKWKCLNAKKQVDYTENVIRFWVSLRQGKYKSAVKYNKLCEEYELYIIDCAVDGRLDINLDYDFGLKKQMEGETEICRVGCEHFCEARKKRKLTLDIYPQTLSNANWFIDVSYTQVEMV
jgi:hypothetical protein